MRARSLRTELSFWYSVVMGVTLLVVGVAFETVAYNRISGSIDNSLRHTAYGVINEYALLGGNLENIADDSASTVVNPSPWPPRYVQLLDGEGRIIYRSRNLGYYALPVDSSVIGTVGKNMVISPDLKLHQGEPIRIITFRLPAMNTSEVRWGQVAVSLHDLDRARKKNELALAFILPAAIAISAIAGRWLAGRALRPIDDVINTARRIRAESLHERLTPREVGDELGRLIETLNELFERLEQNFRQISRFSADVSHELRTPLTIIQGEAEVALRAGATSEEMRLALELVLDEAQRLSKLVRNLLTLARLESGEHKPQFVLTPLAPIIEDLAEEGQVLAQGKGVTLRLGPVDAASLYGDAVLLHQLGYNLLDNAIKYTPPGGLVELSFVAGEKGLRLVVRDTGLGIEKEEQRRIFDRFYRGDKARSHGEGGTGLGLALVKQIAEVHHGTVEVASVAGEGSSFAVTFPVASDATRGPSQVSGMSVAERTRS